MTRSSVEPSTNSPGWRMNGSSSPISTTSVSVLLRLLHVDERVARVVEDAEVPVDPHVDARRLEQRRLIRVDLDPAFVDEPFDGAIGEDHRLILPSARRRARASPFRKASRSRSSRAPSACSSGLLRRSSQSRTARSVCACRRTTVRRRSAGSSLRSTSRWSSSSPVSLLAAGSDRPSAAGELRDRLRRRRCRCGRAAPRAGGRAAGRRRRARAARASGAGAARDRASPAAESWRSSASCCVFGYHR